MCASDEESESCPGTICPTETTDTNVGEWTDWTSCQLSLDRKSAFQVRNRDCSTTDCNDALQESQSCTHAGLALGIYQRFKVLFLLFHFDALIYRQMY